MTYTQYAPKWYKAEETASAVHDYLRRFNLKILGKTASGSYEVELALKAKNYKLEVPSSSTYDYFLKLENLVSQYETLLDNDLATVNKAQFYNIPIAQLDDVLKIEHAIEDWEELLEAAIASGVKWNICNYDPEGLRQAILEHDEKEIEIDHRYTNQVRADYYAGRVL